jgi:nitrogen regulatory protein PII
MKLITAIIKPFKLDDVREAIASLGVEGSDGGKPLGVITRHDLLTYLSV